MSVAATMINLTLVSRARTSTRILRQRRSLTAGARSGRAPFSGKEFQRRGNRQQRDDHEQRELGEEGRAVEIVVRPLLEIEHAGEPGEQQDRRRGAVDAVGEHQRVRAPQVQGVPQQTRSSTSAETRAKAAAK